MVAAVGSQIHSLKLHGTPYLYIYYRTTVGNSLFSPLVAVLVTLSLFSRRKTSCARRGDLPPPISSLQNQLKLKQLPDLHTCILQDSFPGKFNSSWVIRNNFALHLS